MSLGADPRSGLDFDETKMEILTCLLYTPQITLRVSFSIWFGFVATDNARLRIISIN